MERASDRRRQQLRLMMMLLTKNLEVRAEKELV